MPNRNVCAYLTDALVSSHCRLKRLEIGVVFSAELGGFAAGVGFLDRTDHAPRQGNGFTTVVVVANKIPLGFGLNVAGKAVAAKSIHNFGKTALANGCAL